VLRREVGAFVGGLLVGNSAPHLATAVTGRTHLTPLAGRESSAVVNLVWGLGNALAGLALTRACTASGARRWDGSLIAFEAGVATFATWMAASEAALRVNTAGEHRGRCGRQAGHELGRAPGGGARTSRPACFARDFLPLKKDSSLSARRTWGPRANAV
jgi:hypothetical protein